MGKNMEHEMETVNIWWSRICQNQGYIFGSPKNRGSIVGSLFKALNPKEQTPNPKPKTLNPKP